MSSDGGSTSLTRVRAREAVEARLIKAAMALPETAQRAIAGRPLAIDGQRLAVEMQVLLRLQRATGSPDAGTLPVPEGRLAVLRETRVAGGSHPIGAVRDLPVGDRPGRLYTPTGDPKDPTGLLVFFHGGGFVFGDLDTHDAPCRFLAERAGVRVLAVDYRLAPEHPFPAAYDDAVAAYRWAFDNAASLGADPDRIAVGGDSAGGNLAAGAAIAAALRRVPAGLPAADLPGHRLRPGRPAAWSCSPTAGSTSPGATSRSGTTCYLPNERDRTDPRVSRCSRRSPTGLAPAYVATAGFDPLRDEGEAYARLLCEAGVTVEMHRFPDLIHAFLNMLGPSRRSRAAVAEMAVRLGAALA